MRLPALVLLALLSSVLVGACGDEDGPRGVAETFMEGVVAVSKPSEDGRLTRRLPDSARETLTPRLQAALLEAGRGNLIEGIMTLAAVRGLPPAFEIDDVVEEETTAAVDTIWAYPLFPAEVTISLVRIEGHWRIDAIGPSGAAVSRPRRD